MKKLPTINNQRKINKSRSMNNIYNNIKPVSHYKYEEIPSNISQLLFNDQSICQSTFATKIKNANSSSAIRLDHRYYSTLDITKRFPLTRNIYNTNISSILPKNLSATNGSSSSPIYLQDNNNSIKRKKKGKNSNDKKYWEINKIINNNNNNNIVKLQTLEAEMRKEKEKMKRTKFKLYKIVLNHEKSSCRIFERKNNHFNDRLNNYLKSCSFYEKNKKFHLRFHFSKNDLNLCHDYTKHYIEPNNKEKNKKITSNLVCKLLNDEDKKLINSDPYSFLRDNKYLHELTRVQFKTLLIRLKEEEELQEKIRKENEINNYKNNILKFNDSVSSETNNEIKNNNNNDKQTKKITIKKLDYIAKKMKRKKEINNSMKLFNKKYLNKIINEDLNKRLKQKSAKKNENVEKVMIKTITKLNTYKKKDYIFESNNNYYKSYNEKTQETFFKPYSLKRNYERLMKEYEFHKQRNRQNKNDNKENDIILKYQKILEDVYKNNKKTNEEI